MTRDELIEKARQLIDDEVFTHTGRSVGDLASGHVARALADAGLLADPEQHDDRYAVIHVSPRPGSDAWPIVERVPGGWQSGAHHYPDEDVLDVRPLPIPKHECDATLVGHVRDAEAALTRAQAEAVAAWQQVEQARIERNTLQRTIAATRAVLDRPWPDDEDHHDFVNQQVEDARAALRGNQPAGRKPCKYVVSAWAGLPGSECIASAEPGSDYCKPHGDAIKRLAEIPPAGEATS